MLTGRRAFAGDTVTDAIVAILGREPDWSLLPAGTPLAVRRLLQRCLEKDVKQRLRDIGDVPADIDHVLTDLQAPSSGVVSIETPAADPRIISSSRGDGRSGAAGNHGRGNGNLANGVVAQQRAGRPVRTGPS